MHTIRTDFPRPDSDIVAAFSKYPVAVIGDALGRYRTMRSEIKPVWRGARVAGPAFTVQTYPSDNMMLHVGLYRAHPGDVLVADAGGYDEGGLFGEIMTTDAQNAGVAGLVIDGAVRDCEEIEELRFPVWSRAISPKGTQKGGHGSVGIPISCGGQTVEPGDIIVADGDGVVVVPLATCHEVLAAVEEKSRAEARMKDQLRTGKRLYEVLGLEKLIDHSQFRGS